MITDTERQQARQLVRDQLNDLEHPREDLSEWEENFLNDLRDRLERRPTWLPTEAQQRILDRITEEKG